MSITIPRDQIKWCETNLTSAIATPAAGEKVATAPAPASADILAEFNKPHSESEMRALLQTKEGQDLVKNIADAYIGTGTDAGTRAAKESYLNSVLQFASGSMGVLEIQGEAQGVLGQLTPFDKEMSSGPNAEEWKEYKEILQGFTSEAPPAPVPQGR
jgi:hypothetical protein